MHMYACLRLSYSHSLFAHKIDTCWQVVRSHNLVWTCDDPLRSLGQFRQAGLALRAAVMDWNHFFVTWNFRVDTI